LPSPPLQGIHNNKNKKTETYVKQIIAYRGFGKLNS